MMRLLKIKLLLLLFTHFRQGETSFFTRRVKVQIGKNFNYVLNEEKMLTLPGNTHVSFHFFPHRPRLFQTLTEMLRALSARNGHQTAEFRADRINNSISTRSKGYSVIGMF